MCQTTVIFGITKDGSLVLIPLPSWNCFTCRNLLQNGANDMPEWLTCETAFCKKSSKCCILRIIRFWSNFASLWFTSLLRKYKWYFWLLQLSIAMETWKSWNAKLSVKSWFFDREFHIAVANLNIFNKCLYNYTIQTCDYLRILFQQQSTQIVFMFFVFVFAFVNVFCFFMFCICFVLVFVFLLKI